VGATLHHIERVLESLLQQLKGGQQQNQNG
jgi:hypothetical protein